MAPVRIKNCGLSARIEVDMAVRAGASFVGFVHYQSSPRHVPLDVAASLANHTTETTSRVLVTVSPDDALAQHIAAMPAITHLQIHGVTEPERLHALAALSKKPLIIAVSIATRDDITAAQALEQHGEHLLLDSKSSGHGGSGASFDWSLLGGVSFKKPWFLAGGLSTDNIADALEQTRAPMVDVSPGIESAPGQKSLEKIAAFNKAVISHSA